MNPLQSALISTPLLYITRDIERALGLPLSTESYFIISNSTPFGKTVRERHPQNVFLIESDSLLDTAELLEHPEVISRITQHVTRTNAQLLVFKSTPRIETICKQHNWELLNPSAALANTIEEKISQVEWLGDAGKFLPPHSIVTCKDIVWKEKSFILQYNRAHTGTGTLLVTSQEQLKDIQIKFPDRPTRVTEFVQGPVLTSNNVVGKTETLIGNISYQITGLAPFTDNAFATIGNDWKLPGELLSEAQKNEYTIIVNDIAEKLRADGWKGLFGTDMIVDEQTGQVYLLEINARQPASTTYESMLQYKIQDTNKKIQVTTFEAHLMALLDIDLEGYTLIEIQDGAQIILRNQGQDRNYTEITRKLHDIGFTVIPYANSSLGSDLLRIQSTMGVMSKHGVLNRVGEQIAGILATKI